MTTPCAIYSASIFMPRTISHRTIQATALTTSGDVLSLSPVLMEKYLTAAEKISRTAIFGVEPLKPTLVRLRSPERNVPAQLTPLTDYDLTGLNLPNAIHTTYRFPVDGEYVIRASLGGNRPPG